jgi:hypothetical protein
VHPGELPAHPHSDELHPQSSLPLGNVHLDEAIDEADADARVADDLAPLPPMPFGTFDVEEALDESGADTRAEGERPPGSDR